MRNITDIIKQAISQDVLWSVESFVLISDILTKAGFTVHLWNGEENWANLFVDDEMIGYVWAKYPLIFVKSQHAKKLKNDVNDYDYLTIIDVESLVMPMFCIDYNELKERINFSFNTESFSAEDLWFYTNSI